MTVIPGQDWLGTPGIGDVNSTAKGSGARYNVGKPQVDLLPIGEVAYMLEETLDDECSTGTFNAVPALKALGKFQQTGFVVHVYEAMNAMGPARETLVECAQVFEYGKKKYAAWNWAKGMQWSVALACAVRHLLAMHNGEMIDPVEQNGSGLAHRGHVMCNLFMLSTFTKTYPEGNDLPIGVFDA
jgi:hypothetical protein